MGSHPNATIGRPRLFDEQTVLDKLTMLFWRQGYTQTSMTDIVNASGVHKPSLYRTFGTKEELFATILRRYLDDRMAVFAQLVETAGPGIEGVHTFLDLFETDAVSGGSKDGCLMVMASNELRGTTPGYDDFAVAHRRALHAVIRVLVARAAPDAAPTSDEAEQRTDLLSAYMLGLQVIVRSGAAADEIHRYFQAMHATVDTW
ncbi:TetR/AcrR family transcriptional regulator [Sanguibacter antarcticus]|uniref:TetR family transcriptional regulator n=1 Tax=Sanguibacter antarcticus TaxID=372484 RepID=A0A2A9E6H1_9MICO|nr:TetR/AcrR family transcriptional regulator [Sanguibacter antarcticus]PFG33842.1 TetR family transcriptional regulator [Sanguibacter antarcticus]